MRVVAAAAAQLSVAVGWNGRTPLGVDYISGVSRLPDVGKL
jgi:hypothetical protein